MYEQNNLNQNDESTTHWLSKFIRLLGFSLATIFLKFIFNHIFQVILKHSFLKHISSNWKLKLKTSGGELEKCAGKGCWIWCWTKKWYKWWYISKGGFGASGEGYWCDVWWWHGIKHHVTHYKSVTCILMCYKRCITCFEKE